MKYETAIMLFDYDRENGELYWKERPREDFVSDHAHSMRNGRYAGRKAGRVNKMGRKQVQYDGKKYYVHRIVWLLENKELPKRNIDHIDGNPLNNKIENLRDVTVSDNQKNSKTYKSNTSGRVGVYWHKSSKKWQAIIKSNGKYIYLGLFKNINDAINAREVAERKYSFHENHGR